MTKTLNLLDSNSRLGLDRRASILDHKGVDREGAGEARGALEGDLSGGEPHEHLLGLDASQLLDFVPLHVGRTARAAQSSRSGGGTCFSG